ncbi:MAG: hypothetical protein QW678_00695 [Candidatus Aenigmatarchaeota archaeon]
MIIEFRENCLKSKEIIEKLFEKIKLLKDSEKLFAEKLINNKKLIEMTCLINDPDVAIEVVKITSRYPEMGEEIFDDLYGIADLLWMIKEEEIIPEKVEIKDIVFEIAETIKNYKEEVAFKISNWLISTTHEVFESYDKINNIEIIKKICEALRDKEVIQTIGKFEEEIGRGIVHELSRIEYIFEKYFSKRDKNFEDIKNIIIEAVKTIRKYKGKAAIAVAYEIIDTTIVTEDINFGKTMCEIFRNDEIVSIVEKYEEKFSKSSLFKEEISERIVHELGRAAFLLEEHLFEEKDIKDFIVEFAKIIGKRKGKIAAETAEIITKGIKEIIKETDDINIVRIIAEALGDDEIINIFIKRIPRDDEIINIFTKDDKTFFFYIRDLDKEIKKIIRYLLKNKDIITRAIKNLGIDENEYVEKIIKLLSKNYEQLKSIEKNKIIKKYEKSSDKDKIIHILNDIEEKIERNFRERSDVVLEAFRTIGTYDGELGINIGEWMIEEIQCARRKRDLNILKQMCKILREDEVIEIIKKYEWKIAKNFINLVYRTFYELKNKDKPFRMIKMLKNGGIDALKYIISHPRYNIILPKEIDQNIYEIIKENLDGLVTDRNSFLAVLIYFLSNKKLPKPNENNIKEYENIASEEIKNMYKINKNLNLNQMLVFFSLDKSIVINTGFLEYSPHEDKTIYMDKNAIIKRIIELVNNSEEIDPKFYTLSENSMKAVESKNPLDYDDRVLILNLLTDVYLPGGFKIKRGILRYCEDENIILVGYKIDGQTLGSAICFYDKENKIFLVDSIEGHEEFRKEEIFEIVYNDLKARANKRGAQKIVFNTLNISDVNELDKTPRMFNEYLKNKKKLEEKEIEININTKAYLRSTESDIWNVRKKVKGYVINLNN